ncbi:MAG: DNA repair protein RecO, partial [Planctomycetota bacterium]
MPPVTDNAICIRRWDYSETSLTVSLFLRNHGVVRGMAKGAKRARGSFEGGIDLLTL